MNSRTASQVLDYYGGEKKWKEAQVLTAIVDASGWAFRLKSRPDFHLAHIYAELDRPYCRITPIGTNRDVVGVLDGQDVRLQDSRGNVIKTRKDARGYFGGRRWLWWDDLDMTYFAAYAFWNYFTLPRLLQNNAIKWWEEQPGHLIAQFPDTIPTHSRWQEFHFTGEGQLRQHNYVAEVISKFAKASNRVLLHNTSRDVPYPSHRQVTPAKANGEPLGWPILIDIKVLDFQLSD